MHRCSDLLYSGKNGSGTNVGCPPCGGGICGNKSSAWTVLHETGHLVNAIYDPGLPNSSINEGNADALARYVLDDVDGPNICEPACSQRPGDSSRRWCTDQFLNCYTGGPFGNNQANGNVHCGALWKLRDRLNGTLGAPAGGLTADLLLNAWMLAYNDREITSSIQDHFLLLDDDDNDLSNGTPHWADIDRGFVDQGYAITMDGIAVANVQDPGVAGSEAGPFLVTADLTASYAPPISAAKCYYRINGSGSFQSVTMTLLTGSTWQAAIPGPIDSPATVEYYLSVTDSTVAAPTVTGQTIEFPAQIKVSWDGKYVNEGEYPKADATPTYRRFFVGVQSTLLATDFESGQGLWTTGGAASDWELAQPLGLGDQSGVFINWVDPGAAQSGSYCWGNDLTSNGKYNPSQDSYLLSPAVVLPSPITPTPDQRVILRFYRWLSTDLVDGGTALGGLDQYDKAEIRLVANGQELPFWKNHEKIPLVDVQSPPGAWFFVEYELTDTLIGQDSFQVKWCLETNGTTTSRPELGGWSVDDVEILWIGAFP